MPHLREHGYETLPASAAARVDAHAHRSDEERRDAPRDEDAVARRDAVHAPFNAPHFRAAFAHLR